jgi:hypothetical protein
MASYARRMQAWIGILFAAALILAIAIAARRATTVLVIDVDGGRIKRARGRATGEMLRDLGDAVSASSATGRIELHLEGGGVSLRAQGFDAGAEQRVRNVVGRFPAARLRTAPKVNIARSASLTKSTSSK